jgi:hypothetical protein
VGPTQSPVYWIPGFLPCVKWPGREVDHAPSSSSDIKNEWSYTSAPPVCLQGVDRDSYTRYISGTYVDRFTQFLV